MEKLTTEDLNVTLETPIHEDEKTVSILYGGPFESREFSLQSFQVDTLDSPMDTISSTFLHDVEGFQEVFGADSIRYSFLASVDIFNWIQLRLSAEQFPRLQKAYGFGTGDLLVVNFMEVPACKYRGIPLENCDFAVTVRTCSSDVSRHFIIADQLALIIKKFMHHQWYLPNYLPRSSYKFENIWLEVVIEIQRRIFSLNEYCIICDAPNDRHLILPSICSNELCIFGYDRFGLMVDVHTICLKMGKVVDLLLMLAFAASITMRSTIVFEPYPTIVEPGGSNQILLGPKQRDDYLLLDLIKRIPCIRRLQELASIDNTQWPKDLLEGGMDPAIFTVLRWIISSNRTFLQALETQQCLSFMKTPHQFLMLADSPSKQERFVAAKQYYGGKSRFLFHGSPLENWHSILRNGLLNASDTKFQLHGSTEGPGTYLCTSTTISAGFSKHRPLSVCRCNHTNCINEDYFINYSNAASVISICEGFALLDHPSNLSMDSTVVISPSLVEVDLATRSVKDTTLSKLWKMISSQKSAPPQLPKPYKVFVEQNPDHISTRFLFVFSAKCIPKKINLENQLYESEITNAIQKCRADLN